MARAYEDNEAQALELGRGFIFVIPKKKARKSPWQYDTKLYKRLSKVEHFSFVLSTFLKFSLAMTNLILPTFLSVTLDLIFVALFI